MRFAQLVILLVLSLSFVSCSKHRMDAIKFKKLLKEETGDKHKIQKLHTETGSYVVFKNKSTGEYVAYNMEIFDRKGKMSYDQYMAVAVEGTDVVHNLEKNSRWVEDGYWSTVTHYDGEWVYDEWDDDWDYCDTCGSSWTEDVWVDTSYTYYWYTGNGFSFSNSELNATRDLETISGMAEEAQVSLLTTAISSQFSLSTDRAAELAKLSVKYDKLENARELTSKEKEYFAMNALGVSYADLTNSYRSSLASGSSEFKKLMKKAADFNKTSVENLTGYVKDYLSVEIE